MDVFKEIHGFRSIGEYHSLRLALEKKLLSGHIEKITVERLDSSIPFGVNEEWFRDKKSQRIWRLIDPDPPFLGLWEPVS